MSASFDHVVLTRFNVRMPMYEHPPDSWLDGRCDLFERWTLPSMAAQTETAFTWLLLFDARTSDTIRGRVEGLRRRYDGLFEVVYLDEVFTAQTASRLVAERVRADYVITTRLDNDDAVARDFVETVQRQFDAQTLAFVNIVSGAQWCRGRTYRRPYTNNPFASLVERRGPGPLRTVFTARHFAIDQVAPVVNVRTPHPSWLQVVHGENVLNEVVGLRVRADTVAPYFGCVVEAGEDGLGYYVDRTRSAARIVVRLVSRPHRLVALARAALARSTRSSRGPQGGRPARA